MDEMLRKDFELWAVDHKLDRLTKGTALQDHFARRPDGEYMRDNIQTLWECWQEAFNQGAGAAW